MGAFLDQDLPLNNLSTLMDIVLEENKSSLSDILLSNKDIPFATEDEDISLELSDASQAVLISLYTVTIFLSISGNLTVIIVLCLGSRSKSEVTVFLTNLAIADLCMACFCMPFTFTQTMLGRWIFGKLMCPLVLFMQVTSVAVSIFTNMAIGLDRYWMIYYPLKKRLTKRWAKLIVFIIWFVSAGLASAQWLYSRSEERHYLGYSWMDCNEKWPNNSSRHAYTLLISLSTYVFPLAILGCVYYRMAVKLWKRQIPGNANFIRDKIVLKSKRKVIKLMATLVVVFAICWFPLQTFNLVLDLAPHLLDKIRTQKDAQAFVAVYYACHWLAMANSFTNPIIFCFLNNNFRADAEYIWKRALHRDPSLSPSNSVHSHAKKQYSIPRRTRLTCLRLAKTPSTNTSTGFPQGSIAPRWSLIIDTSSNGNMEMVETPVVRQCEAPGTEAMSPADEGAVQNRNGTTEIPGAAPLLVTEQISTRALMSPESTSRV